MAVDGPIQSTWKIQNLWQTVGQMTNKSSLSIAWLRFLESMAGAAEER